MFSQNVVLASTDTPDKFYIVVNDQELTTLNNKYKGMVSVKISKPVEKGTEEQNRLMHGLMAAFFLTGMHSSPAKSIDEFKLWLKFQIGVCYDYEYQGKPCRVPKSWSLYNKTERMQFIDAVISLVIQSGAPTESEKITKILNGLEKNKI